MFYFYVYLILSQDRLFISNHAIDDKDFYNLIINSGDNEELGKLICNHFCVGYILGSSNGIRRPVINSLEEFQ